LLIKKIFEQSKVHCTGRLEHRNTTALQFAQSSFANSLDISISEFPGFLNNTVIPVLNVLEKQGVANINVKGYIIFVV